MILWKKYFFIPYFVFCFLPLTLSAQRAQNQPTPGDSFADNVSFKNPEGYVDTQFRELASEYLQPKVPEDIEPIVRREQYLTPESLQRLIDLVAQQVSIKLERQIEQTQRERRSRESRPNLPPLSNVGRTTALKANTFLLPEATAISSMERPRKRIIVQDKGPTTPITLAKKPRNTSTTTTRRSGNIRPAITEFSLSGVRNRRVNLNSSSVRTADIFLSYGNNVDSVRVELIATHLGTRKSEVVSMQDVSREQGLSPVQVRWNLANQPMGRYRISSRVTFFNRDKERLATDTKLWGNTPSSTEFLAIRN